MSALESVSKPAPSGLESSPAEEKRMREGSAGSGSDERSRAAAALLTHGKSETPIVSSGSGGVESVIGTDERQRIFDTDLAPWRMNCALRLFNTSGSAAVGTGWMAGPKTIVTAGHCVHDSDFFNGWASRIKVSAGRDANTLPFGTVTATRFSALSTWVNSSDPDFDIGCIHLDEPLGDKTGYYGFAALPASDLSSHLVNVSGYPADLAQGTKQYFHANRVLHVSDHRIFYDVDTFGGQSGSGVTIKETATSDPVVVAIHAYGTGGTPFNLGITANSAPRITSAVFDIIQAWVDADS